MYITSPKRKNGSTVIRLVECFREEGKVKTRVVKTIGQSKDPEIIKYYQKKARHLLDEHKKGRIQLSDRAWKMSIDLNRFLGEDRYNHGFEDILGASYKSLGFEDLIKSGRKNQGLNDTLKSLVLMRVFSPESKLKSCHLLRTYFNKHYSHKQVLTMMDHLQKHEGSLKQHIFKLAMRGEKSVHVLLFDVTTLHFESVKADDLRGFGYSKDGKFNEVQVVLAVLADQDGMPLTYELFSGHTAETRTLREVLSQAIKKHPVQRIRVTADRAMFSEKNFDFFNDFNKKKVQVEYVVSCPLRKLPLKLKQEVLDLSHYRKGQGDRLYYDFEYKGRRIVVSYSEKLKEMDEKKRQRLLERLKALAPKGEVSASRLINNCGVRKFMEKVKGKVKISTEKIIEESRWDGIYGVCTNMKEPSHKILSLYRNLWKIEELFRINKHTLKMRPIYHRLSKRIRAHIMICFLAYTVLKYTQIILQKAKLSFSPEELIDILKEVESFIIKDKAKKKAGEVYCIPRKLSKEARQIYKAFKKGFIDKPYVKASS